MSAHHKEVVDQITEAMDKASKSNSAAFRYQLKRKAIEGRITQLQELLRAADEEQLKDQGNWSRVGSMDHVFAELTDIVQFLAS